MAEGSIWKKEIKLRKKSGPPATAAPQPPVSVPAGDRPTSIWKRELKLRKPAAAVPVVAEEPPVEVAQARTEETTPRFEPAPAWEAPEPSVPFEPLGPEAVTHEWEAYENTPLPDPEPVVPAITPIAIPVAAAVVEAPVEAPPVPEPEPEPEVVPEATEPEAPKKPVLKRDLKLPTLRGRKAKTVATAAAATRTAKSLVGLRIGSSQLAAACVNNNGSAELVQLSRARIPRGIVSSGEVRDIEGLTRELKSFFSANKLPKRGIRLGIASNRIGVRNLEVPAVDDPKLFENSIRFHAQETLPIAVNDAILDYVVLGEGSGQGLEPTVRVLLVFAHRELVDRHVEACKRAGLKLEGVDFEGFALLRALAAPRPGDVEPTEAVVAVAVGHERTIFAVSDGRICDFTRVLEWGSGSLDIAIARALNLTPSQAEPIKVGLALDSDVAPSQLSPEQVETAKAAVRTELQVLSRELVSSLQFYQTRSESLDIGAILLSGGGAELTGFAAELERLVGVPVRMGDPLGRIELSRKVARPAEPGSLAIAIGLGIED
jgi:type IV pilus assembly protein PilM